jgi:isocitrate lyase
MYPDQSLYPVDSVPAWCGASTQALLRADQIEHAEGKQERYWFAPIMADAEAGFGGPLNAYELMKAMIEAGAAGVHFEDQLASEKKCGHMGGKVLVPTSQFIRTLVAARLAADVLDVPTVLVARTDATARSCSPATSTSATCPSSPKRAHGRGLLPLKGGVDFAIARGWPTRRTPTSSGARRRRPTSPRRSVRRGCAQEVPGQDARVQLLALVQLEEEPRRRDHRQVPARARGHGLQVPVRHAGRLPRAQLLDVRARPATASAAWRRTRAAAGGVRAEKVGYTATRHQREVGTGYFDEVAEVISGEHARLPDAGVRLGVVGDLGIERLHAIKSNREALGGSAGAVSAGGPIAASCLAAGGPLPSGSGSTEARP